MNYIVRMPEEPILRIPNGVRTRVTAVKGRRPRPLDDGDLFSGTSVWDFRPIVTWTEDGRLITL